MFVIFLLVLLFLYSSPCLPALFSSPSFSTHFFLYPLHLPPFLIPLTNIHLSLFLSSPLYVLSLPVVFSPSICLSFFFQVDLTCHPCRLLSFIHLSTIPVAFLFTYILLIIPCISDGWRTPRVLFLSPSHHQAVISISCYPRGLDRCQPGCPELNKAQKTVFTHGIHTAVIGNKKGWGKEEEERVTRGIRLDIVGQVETVKGQEECKMRFYFYSNNMKPSCIEWN